MWREEIVKYIYKETVGSFQPHRKEDIVAQNNLVDNAGQASSEKRSYSVDEAAQILGVSKRSVYNLCAQEAFKSVRIGTKLRISKKSFDEWLDGNT